MPDHTTLELESVPSFSSWKPLHRQIAILLSMGFSKAKVGKELGITSKTVCNVSNKGTKEFSAHEFQRAVNELIMKIGIGSDAQLMIYAQERIQIMEKAGRFPSGDRLLDFILEIKGKRIEQGPKSIEATFRATFSEETLEQAERELMERTIGPQETND